MRQKIFDILAISLSILHNYFDNSKIIFNSLAISIFLNTKKYKVNINGFNRTLDTSSLNINTAVFICSVYMRCLYNSHINNNTNMI